MQKYFDFISDDIVRSAVALAGGGGSSAMGSCGAFSGGLMVLSVRFSLDRDELSEQEITEYELVSRRFYEFRDWFIAEFGGVSCRDVQRRLLGRFYNLMDDGEYRAFRDYQKIHGRKCIRATTGTVLKVAEMLLEE